MADYDYALRLEPLNVTALFNRGLLLAEVSANDLALADFNKVLELEPDDFRALYNRALINRLKGNTTDALSDISRVVERFPDFPGALYIRSQIYKDRGELRAADRDYKKALAAAKALKPANVDSVADDDAAVTSGTGVDVPEELQILTERKRT